MGKKAVIKLMKKVVRSLLAKAAAYPLNYPLREEDRGQVLTLECVDSLFVDKRDDESIPRFRYVGYDDDAVARELLWSTLVPVLRIHLLLGATVIYWPFENRFEITLDE